MLMRGVVLLLLQRGACSWAAKLLLLTAREMPGQ